ncbi:hypothetical protein SLE2022_252840 [Rubroshorea leprosula]
MGQAFRRASGRIRAVEPSPPSKPKTPFGPTGEQKVSRATQCDNLGLEGTSRANPDNVLEERDPKYDAMLSPMVGRITSKSGGRPEMGEAAVVEKYNRPLPKLRNTKPDSGYEERSTLPGTLNVAQLRHIMLLHQGKADDHDGPMDVHQIAERFRIDVAQVQRIIQFLSLPPEDSSKQKNYQ